MEEERDIVVFSDDEGNEFEMEVIDYFEHEGQEYGVLTDPEPEECKDCNDDCDKCDKEWELYIMKIVVDGDMEEFLPADEDKMDELSKIVDQRFAEAEKEDK